MQSGGAMSARILVVDDDDDVREIFREKLSHHGYEVETATNAEDALAHVKEIDPDIILTDLKMPGMTGLELLEKVRDTLPRVEVIVVTGHEDMGSAVSAMKAGAFDYLVKPVDLDRVESLVARCRREQELNREVAEQEAGSEEQEEPDEGSRDRVVGKDPRMIEIYKMIGVLSRNRATVLVRGETGTGKEMIARAIHANSAHADEPFIAVNCTALTDTLLESELFGHAKGAFTGAVANRRGYFELAGSGTVFLDEIGDTSPEFQTKLLRVLQERTFYPVGGEEQRATEARIVAATHQPIERRVEEGAFREDLYFRLRVVEIRVPPLRERKDDIPKLADTLLKRIRKETRQRVRHISTSAMELLMEHEWPGNVRELENALTRAAILARGAAIAPEHLSLLASAPVDWRAVRGASTPEPASSPHPAAPAERDVSLDSAIARHVQKILVQARGNKSETARLLEISRSRLQRIVEKFDLDVPDEAS